MRYKHQNKARNDYRKKYEQKIWGGDVLIHKKINGKVMGFEYNI
jgi:uncharacterized protein YuzE